MTTLTITDHRLADVPFRASPNMGGRIEPSLIVVHDTAGRLDKGGTVSWFCDPKARVSAHVVVERDGAVTQVVPFDRAAWHAGKSSWKGRASCNGFAIGIEIVNPGKLTRVGSAARAWFGEGYDIASCVEIGTTAHGHGWWLAYTDAQIATVRALIEALAAHYPTITDVAAHWEISPGRKVDTGPNFPLSDMKALISGRWELSRIEIENAQRRLDALGYWPGPVDGIMGPKTRSAIRDFQEQHELPVLDGKAREDGGLDRATWQRLFAEDARPAPKGTADPGAAVAAAERTARDASIAKRVTEVFGGLSIAEALVEVSAAVGTAETAKSLGSRIGDLMAWAATPRGLVAVGAVIACGAVWAFAHRIARHAAPATPDPGQ